MKLCMVVVVTLLAFVAGLPAPSEWPPSPRRCSGYLQTTGGIPFPEVYNALQAGVIGAQENPILAFILMKFTAVTKNVTLTITA